MEPDVPPISDYVDLALIPLYLKKQAQESLWNLSIDRPTLFPVQLFSGSVRFSPQQGTAGALSRAAEDPSGPAWLQLASSEQQRGVYEYEGAPDNPRVVQYLKVVGSSDDEVPWCSAFVNWCMLESGYTPTYSAMARSWLNWGVEVEARHGAIVVLQRGQSAVKGHVGFFLNQVGNEIRVLGGNQSDSVRISNYPAARVLGYRWPSISNRRVRK